MNTWKIMRMIAGTLSGWAHTPFRPDPQGSNLARLSAQGMNLDAINRRL